MTAPADSPPPGGPAGSNAAADAAPAAELADLCARSADALVARWKAERADAPSQKEITEINLLREDLLNAVAQLAEQAAGRAEAETEAARKIARAQDDVLRAKADFVNYQERQKRELTRLLTTGMRGFVEALVPWLDNFEVSLKCTTAPGAEPMSAQGIAFRDAMQLVHDQLLQVLQTKGLKRFSAQGQRFNPALHESVAKIPAPDKRHQEVIEEVRPGYHWQDLVLRPAGVVIAENPGNLWPAETPGGGDIETEPGEDAGE